MATLSKKFVVLGAAALVGAALAAVGPSNGPEISAADGSARDMDAAAAATSEGDKVMEAAYSPASP